MPWEFSWPEIGQDSEASSDQASVYSNDSRTRGNSIYYPKSNTNSQTTFSSIGLDAGSLLPMATSAPRDSHRHNLLHSNQSSPFSSSQNLGQRGFDIERPPDHVVEKEFMNLMVKRGWKSMPEQARRQMEAYKID